MAESASQHLSRLEKIEADLLREVERAGAEFHGSLNGNREAAACGFEKALQVFSDFIARHQLPKM
jgi:hypothetical protein